MTRSQPLGKDKTGFPGPREEEGTRKEGIAPYSEAESKRRAGCRLELLDQCRPLEEFQHRIVEFRTVDPAPSSCVIC